MALSRALLKRLNSEDYPLPKRLKLAEHTFSAMDIPLVRKKDLLLEWLCKMCITDPNSWKSLNNCLKCSYIDVSFNAKQCLIDTLIQTLNNEMKDTYEDVLECCQLTLADNNMRQYFANRPKNLSVLVKTLLNNILQCSTKYNEAEITQIEDTQIFTLCQLSSVEHNTVMSVIESIIQIYKRSIAMKEELRIIFIHDILYSVCSLIDHRHTDGTNKLGVLAYKCIQQIVLGKSKCLQNKKHSESILTLFSVLSENIETLNLQSNLLTYVFIFRAAIGTYKSDTALLDQFFRNLINSSGRYKWEILNACLKLLNDVTLDFENIVEDLTLSEYCQKLINDILTYEDMTQVHYELLAQFSYINPLLIEKNIPNILNKILLEEQIDSYTILLNGILHTASKLRREQKFISQLLISLKHCIVMKKGYTINSSTFLPHDFKNKFVKSISNITSSQAIATLKTLMYYLNIDCMELLQCDISSKNILMLKVTVELLVALFEGIEIFEYTRTLSAHQKFVNTFEELGNTLSLLVNKALCLSHNRDVIIILMNAVQSLSEMQNMFKYYVSKDAIAKKLPFPILDDSWQQLIQRITNFGEENCKNVMNKVILHRTKLNTSKNSIKLHSLIGGVKSSWTTILRHDTDVLSLLNYKEISKVTNLLLADMTSCEKSFYDWIDIVDKECLQENKYFIMCLLSQILIQLGQCLSLKCIDFIETHMNGMLLIEEQNNENNKLLDILKLMKEAILQQEWMKIININAPKIELYLEALLHIPIIYLSHNTRILIFMIIYFTSRACDKNDKITALCNMIFSDLLEKIGIDVFQYIGSSILINHLSQNKVFSKACELSLRNVSTYATLKNFIKSAQCREAKCIILECIENVKPKLNTEQKAIFRKAENRLAKTILNLLPEEINTDFDLRCLIVVLKVAILNKRITETLKKITELTLHNIFQLKENLITPTNNILLQQGLELASIVLRHRKIFEIQDETSKNVWLIMLKHPYENVLKPLLMSTELKDFREVLKILHNKTINSLLDANEKTWTNLFIIWNSIMKTDMRVKRNKLRFVAINNLLLTVQSLHIPDECWSDLLHLSHNIIGAKHLLIPDNTIDIIIMIGLESIKKTNVLSCESALLLCRMLVSIRTNLITDRLPTVLQLYRNLVTVIVQASTNIINKFDEHRFRCFALDIEKLTGLLVKLKKDMVQLSPNLIADLLQLISEGTAPSYIKASVQNSLCRLISICDQHGIALLSRTLPTSLQEIFKAQLNIFKKFYKYSGKI